MSDYLAVANHPGLLVVSLILLAVVMGQALIFMHLAMKRARQFQIPKEKLWRAIKTSAITTVIPSIAVVIALITLVPVLGLAFSWSRLSVIGSLSYELMAAEIGAAAAGTALNSATYDASAFLASMFAMTLGSAPTLFITALFYKKYKAGLNKGMTKKGDKVYTSLLMNALMIGLYCPFTMKSALGGGTGLVALVGSGVAMLAVNYAIKTWKLKRLNDFALSIAMLVGMGAVVVYSL